MPSLLYVMLGGAVGAGFRYQISAVALRNLGPGFPWGTWIINLLGGLLMGVGVLGGFTTFSAFSLEAANMLLRGQVLLATAYVVSSAAGAIMFVFIGLFLTRALA